MGKLIKYRDNMEKEATDLTKKSNSKSNKSTSEKEVVKGDNKARNIVIIVLVVLAVIAIILGVVVMMNNNKDDGDKKGDDSSLESGGDDKADEKEETKVVGDNTYGYVTIPKSWNEVPVDDGEGLQWGDTKNNYYVSLLVADKDEISAADWSDGMKQVFEQRNISDVETKKQKIGDIGEAYVITGYYKLYSRYLAAYIVESGDKVYYISIEGPEKDNDFFKIPETFKTKK